MKLILEIIAGPDSGRTFPIEDGRRMEAGRTAAIPICIPHDRRVSRRHFLLERQGDTCTLEDLGSSNGTFVNDEQVVNAVIRAGDRITAGSTIFTVRAVEEPPVAAAEGIPATMDETPPEHRVAFTAEEDFLAEAAPPAAAATVEPTIKLNNTTLFPAAHLLWRDPAGALKLTVIVKASFYLDEHQHPKIAADQPPILTADQHYGDDLQRPVRLENEMVPRKPRADVVLIGKVHAPEDKPVRTLDAGLRVGDLTKIVRVFGDRYWAASPDGTTVTATEPKPFTRVELTYERAYGGCDKALGAVYDRNPVGTGYVEQFSVAAVDGVRLPNFEDPRDLIHSWRSRPEPAGFGFYGRGWMPRSNYADQEDSASSHAPEFFNGAHPDLQPEGYLAGDEIVELMHLSAAARVKFSLPGIRPWIKLHHRPKPGAGADGALSAAGGEEDSATLAGGNVLGVSGEVVLDTLVLLPEDDSFHEVFRTVFDLSQFEPDAVIEVLIIA